MTLNEAIEQATTSTVKANTIEATAWTTDESIIQEIEPEGYIHVINLLKTISADITISLRYMS